MMAVHFLVRWKNFSAQDDTWECESNLMCPGTLQTKNEFTLKLI